MFELRSLTERERINVAVQCEPFFLVTKEVKVFSELYKKLMVHFNSKYKKEVLLVLTALIKAVKYGNKGTYFSLMKGNYTTANRIHKQKLSVLRAKHVIEVLDKEGFITYYKGFNVNKDFNMKTCLIMSDELHKMIDPKLARKYGLKRDPTSYIEIKDKNDKTIFLSITDFRGYSVHVKFMEKYNNFLARNSVEVIDECTGEMNKCATIYKRVFSENLEGAGRFYATGKFQVLKSRTRKYMLINKQTVTEVDVSNFHPRILYTLEGVKLPDEWDAYDINSLQWIANDKAYVRNFLKGAYLSVLFSDNEDQAVSSVLQKANKDKNIQINSKVLAQKVVSEILNKNESIRQHFFKDRLWAKLQNIDSRFAKFVIDKHLEKDIVCLGWHDSWVVPEDKHQFLIDTMKEAWYCIFGTHKNFKCSTEF